MGGHSPTVGSAIPGQVGLGYLIKVAETGSGGGACFNPSSWEAETGGSLLSLRPAWSIELVPGQLGLLHRKKTKQNKKRGVGAKQVREASQ